MILLNQKMIFCSSCSIGQSSFKTNTMANRNFSVAGVSHSNHRWWWFLLLIQGLQIRKDVEYVKGLEGMDELSVGNTTIVRILVSNLHLFNTDDVNLERQTCS